MRIIADLDKNEAGTLYKVLHILLKRLGPQTISDKEYEECPMGATVGMCWLDSLKGTVAEAEVEHV